MENVKFIDVEKYIILSDKIRSILSGCIKSTHRNSNDVLFHVGRVTKANPNDENKIIIEYYIYCVDNKDIFKFLRYGLTDFKDSISSNTNIDRISSLILK